MALTDVLASTRRRRELTHSLLDTAVWRYGSDRSTPSIFCGRKMIEQANTSRTTGCSIAGRPRTVGQTFARVTATRSVPSNVCCTRGRTNGSVSPTQGRSRMLDCVPRAIEHLGDQCLAQAAARATHRLDDRAAGACRAQQIVRTGAKKAVDPFVDAF